MRTSAARRTAYHSRAVPLTPNPSPALGRGELNIFNFSLVEKLKKSPLEGGSSKAAGDVLFAAPHYPFELASF